MLPLLMAIWTHIVHSAASRHTTIAISCTRPSCHNPFHVPLKVGRKLSWTDQCYLNNLRNMFYVKSEPTTFRNVWSLDISVEVYIYSSPAFPLPCHPLFILSSPVSVGSKVTILNAQANLFDASCNCANLSLCMSDVEIHSYILFLLLLCHVINSSIKFCCRFEVELLPEKRLLNSAACERQVWTRAAVNDLRAVLLTLQSSNGCSRHICTLYHLSLILHRIIVILRFITIISENSNYLI